MISIKKIAKYCLIALGLILVVLIAFLLITSEEDDGKRKTIQVSKVDWNILLEDESVDGVETIKVENETIFKRDDVVEYVKIFNKNKKFISNTKKNGYSKIYVMFEKNNYISTDSFTTKYNGKETTFYIKTTLIEDLFKENEKNIKEYKERNPDIDIEN